MPTGRPRPVPARLAARRRARCAGSTACCASSSSCRARRSRPRPSSGSCCPRGCATTPPRCSTSSPPPARSSGAGTARCPATTAGSRCTSPSPRPLTLPLVDPEASTTPLHEAVLEALDGGNALFFRGLSDRVGSLDDDELLAVLWDLAWSGRLTNDTLGPLRTLVGGGRGGAPRRAVRPLAARYGRPGPRRRCPSRSGPPTVSGRWSLLPDARDRPHAARPRPRRDACSTGTASSPAARSSPSAPPAGSPPSTGCSPPSRRSAGPAAATPSRASAPPSSSCPGAVDRLRTYAPGPDQRREPVHGHRPGRDRPRKRLRRRAPVARAPG